MNSVEHSIQNLMPKNISEKEEIRRIQDAKKGDTLYTAYAFNDALNERYEEIIRKANVSYSTGHTGESIIYTKI